MPKQNGREDRRARVEQMRREQQARERRHSLIIYGSGGLLALIVLAAAIIPSVLHARSQHALKQVGYVTSISGAAKAAGCTGVRNDKDYGNTHVTTTVKYAQSPPSSGNHNADPLPEGPRFYARDAQPVIERAVHNLEHGFVIGWYDQKLPDAQVAALKAYSAKASTRFIAVPWNRADFADGRHFVLTGWDRTQRYTTVSPTAIDAFVKKYVNPTTGADWPSPTAPESNGVGGTMSTPTTTPTTTPTSPAPTTSPSGSTSSPSSAPTSAGASSVTPSASP